MEKQKRRKSAALQMTQNNGFWVHSDHLWWSNEDTVLLGDHVDRRKIADLLKNAQK